MSRPLLLGHLFPHHEPSHLVDRDLGGPATAGDAPVAQDGHAVGDAADLFEAVADVDEAHTLAAKLPQTVEEQVRLRIRQRGSGLIENQNPALLLRERGGDLHELLPAHPQRRDGRARIDGAAQAHRRQCLARGLAHRLVTNHP